MQIGESKRDSLILALCGKLSAPINFSPRWQKVSGFTLFPTGPGTGYPGRAFFLSNPD